ncbi:MFS transporter [Lonepinella koalarum]|uniref:MFS transporter n=1 Tax=Lonepinella koalarum TaxID=53417 RepID=UPI0011E46AC0|nr:MFS transporter [Lonepinella koalarum]TYG34332.1 MFS transporter [Lonepinella koalarum]
MQSVKTRRSRMKWVMFFAFLTLSLNLRAPITSLPPVISEIKASLAMSPVFAGVLTTIPVLCFGLFTPFASKIIGKMGIENSVMLSLMGVTLGSILRAVGDTGFMLSGTIIIGLSLTIGNLLGLLIIARDFKSNASFMTGMMVLGMSLGGMITSSLTVPMSHLLDWRWALASWSLLALLSLFLWIPRYRREKAKNDRLAIRIEESAVKKSTISLSQFSREHVSAIIALTVSFSCHCFAFYGVVAWLPSFLVEFAQMSSDKAGVVVSIFHLLGFIGCLGMPLLGKWFKLSQKWLFIIDGLAWFLVPVGFYLLPDWWLLWDIMGGIGCGGAYVVIFSLIISKSSSLEENRYTSSVVQSIGYVMASLSPMIIGGLYQLSGAWLVSFVVLAITTLIFLIGGLLADRFYSYAEK